LRRGVYQRQVGVRKGSVRQREELRKQRIRGKIEITQRRGEHRERKTDGNKTEGEESVWR